MKIDIQGMFNLEKQINDQFKRLNEIVSLPDDKFDDDVFSIEDAHFARLIEYEKKLLPLFTPMVCKNCTKYNGCNFVRTLGVCNEYEVEIEDIDF
jgi:hypothetical protein